MKRIFRVKAVWDPEAGVFFSQSDIHGLHIEAADLADFEAVMMDVAPELIMANHRTAREIFERPFKELIPTIVWQPPDQEKTSG